MADIPFGYWVEQKHADRVLLRKPAYIPEPSDLRTVTPLYAASLSQNVISLVIAAREAFDTGMLPDEEQTALDQALECFASAVPYENEPATRAAPPAMDREAVKEAQFLLDRLEEFEREIIDDEVFTHFNGHVSPSAARLRMCLSTLSADAIRQGEGFVRMVSCLTHSGDDGWTPDDADDAAQTLDGLIAKARTTISGHSVDCAWHVDQYPHECTCPLATPASHASDGGEA